MRTTIPLTLLCSLLITSCASPGRTVSREDEAPQYVAIDEQQYFGSTAHSWAIVDDAGAIEQIGITVPLSAIESSPTEMQTGERTKQSTPLSVRLAFSKDVSVATFVDHVDLDYSPAGHSPEAYEVPHFDIRFYGVTAEEQLAVDCTNLTPTPAAVLPADFVTGKPGVPPRGECVVRMGHRSVDTKTPEPFTKTMALGSYAGKVTFLEPMVSREQLRKRESFTIDIPVPPGLEEGILFPTVFDASYDEEADAYDFVLGEFVLIGDESAALTPTSDAATVEE